jgi:ElaB/YqjD/DUF883 family membrane-anchored ribosome-binding protein
MTDTPSTNGTDATDVTEDAADATYESAESNELADKVTNVALGAPVAVADLVNQAIDRWRDSDQRDKDIQALRDQLEKGLNVAEEKGVDVRKQLTGRIEPTIQRVQTEVRERGGKVTSTTTEQVRKAQERVRGLA